MTRIALALLFLVGCTTSTCPPSRGGIVTNDAAAVGDADLRLLP